MNTLPALAALDARGHTLRLAAPPARVVSLVPSDTFSVACLGAASRLVGRTEYCVEPASIQALPSLGGTKNPRLAQILDLRPDVVLANQEENTRGDIEALEQAGVPVYVSFPKDVEGGFAHLAQLAALLGVAQDETASALLLAAQTTRETAQRARAARAPLRVFCPIWMDPLMTIHADTFLSDALDLAGGYNVFSDRPRRYPLAADLGRAMPLPPALVAGRDTRYPRVTLAEVEARAPEVVLLPDEPHPFSPQDAEVFRALDIPAAKRGAIVFCPGKDLCWAGAQSIEGIPRLAALLDSLRA
jgi:ABC-type Fe3+-hydroxamate transport system substrate-binding protein